MITECLFIGYLVCPNTKAFSVKYLFCIPAELSPIFIHITRYAIRSAVVSHGIVDSTNVNKPISGSIVRLSCHSRPLTIFRRVITVIINPVNRMFTGWFSAHVREEVNKPIFARPPITHPYAAPTIPMIGPIVGVATPMVHSVPRGVFVFLVKIAAMFVLRVISAAKLPGFKTLSTTPPGEPLPPTCETSKLVAAVATNSKATTPITSVLLLVANNFKRAFTVHKHSIHQRSSYAK